MEAEICKLVNLVMKSNLGKEEVTYEGLMNSAKWQGQWTGDFSGAS